MAVFRLSPAPKSKASPLDVSGVNLNVKTQDLVAAVREGRERPRRKDCRAKDGSRPRAAARSLVSFHISSQQRVHS
jgi:hypothetical protein